jgi:hypothetical protein
MFYGKRKILLLSILRIWYYNIRNTGDYKNIRSEVMLDISKLNIGDIFYNVNEIFYFTENIIVDKKDNLIFVHRKDLSGNYEDLEKEEFYGMEEAEDCYNTKEEAEQIYNDNVSRIQEELKDVKTLLNRLYIRAFSDKDIESELYKKAIYDHINSINTESMKMGKCTDIK